MKQFHKEGDEKRTPVIVPPELHKAWLAATPHEAASFMSWQHMPTLYAEAAPRSAV